MSQTRFQKTATTKAKNPRTWEITYVLVDGPAIKPKKPKKPKPDEDASKDTTRGETPTPAEPTPREKAPAAKKPAKKGAKATQTQESLSLFR